MNTGFEPTPRGSEKREGVEGTALIALKNISKVLFEATETVFPL